VTTDAQTIALGDDDGIVAARQTARLLARELGFGLVDQSRIATAVSELARNVVRYADGRGEVVIQELRPSAGLVGLEVVVRDDGPGIANVAQAMQDGFTSGAGLGLGLSGAKRLVDEFSIESVVGRGTIVTIRKWRR
jgi:serine/threonine-protein kinase RsbT